MPHDIQQNRKPCRRCTQSHNPVWCPEVLKGSPVLGGKQGQKEGPLRDHHLKRTAHHCRPQNHARNPVQEVPPCRRPPTVGGRGAVLRFCPAFRTPFQGPHKDAKPMPKTAGTLKKKAFPYFASKHSRCKMMSMLIKKAPVRAQREQVALYTTARASKSNI